MSRVALLISLLACLPAAAQADTTLVVARSGYYILLQDAAGVPMLVKITSVINLDVPTKPPEPPPVNPPLDVHRAAVTTATAAVTDPNKANVRKALAELYRTVAGLPVTTRAQLVQATDTLFNALNLPAWAPWKTAVDRSLAGFASLDDAKKAWVVVAEVLGQ